MLDQLIIGDKRSYDDYSASVSERSIGAPQKKVIKETVPFSNITYDFSNINGEIYWEERSLEYKFEIIAETPEELEVLKIKFSTWIMNVMNEEIYDPFIKDYHYKATFDTITYEDDESIEKTTITVVFAAYPYLITNEKKRYEIALTEEEAELEVVNNSAHRITPTFITDTPMTIKIDENTYSIGAGSVTDEKIKLKRGKNALVVGATNGSGTFAVEFREEVF